MKTLEDYFTDWEGHVFGSGYGTGEPYVLEALIVFLRRCYGGTYHNMYNHVELEKALGGATTWLLISALCRADMIDYGTSPRHGWLSPGGQALRNFVAPKKLDELLQTVFRSEPYIRCAPDYCNCDDGDCRKLNPFWPRGL